MGWSTGATLAAVMVPIMLYILAVLALRRTRAWGKSVTLWGPFLMLRTKRGQRLLNRLAKRKRLWRLFGSAGVLVCHVVMVIMIGFLMMSAAFILMQPDIEPLPPSRLLVLPGINPIMPLWYSLFALIVAVVIHELSHGILSKVGGLRVRSMGVLWFVIPMGAFVEPDEKDMGAADRRVRRRVFAAGPMSNIVFAIICAAIFSWGFMSSLEPVQDGILVMAVEEDSPADLAGIEPGMLIYEFNGEPVTDHDSFVNAIEGSRPNQTVRVDLLDGETDMMLRLRLVDKYEFYSAKGDFSEDDIVEFKNSSLVGVHTTPLREYRDMLARPFWSGDGTGEKFTNLLYFGSVLPLNTQLMPLHEPFTDYFEIGGPLGYLPDGAFWVLANALYYMFWINILLGMFNAIPMVPLDGGPIFRDTLMGYLEKRHKDMPRKKKEVVAGKVTMFLALFIFALILFVIIAPYF